MTPDRQKRKIVENKSEPGERFYHRPVVPLLFSLIAGILARRAFTTPFPHMTLFAWIFILSCLLLLIRSLLRQRPVKAVPLFLFFILGWVAISSWLPPAFPPAAVLPYLDQKPHKISGTVLKPPVFQGFRTRYVLTDIAVYPRQNPQLPVSLPGKIQLTVYGNAPEVLPGFRVSSYRQIRSIRNFNNPGGFDYRQYMAYRDIWGTTWDNGSRIKVASPASVRSLSMVVSNMRMAIGDAIATVSEGDNHAVLSALVIGKKDLISTRLRESFSRAGVSHLLAISGLHVGIVATVCFTLMTFLFRYNTFLLKYAMVKKAGALFSMVFVIGYGIIAGMSPSTQRAVIMICIFLFAYVFDRQYNPVNTLAAAALGILAVSPHSVFDISFQLSFAAVTAILIGLYWIPLFPKPANPDDHFFRKKILRTVAGFVWISTMAVIGTMPLVAYYFNQVTILGIAANLVLIPLIGFLVVPLGLFSVLLYFLFEPIALFGFSIADRLLHAALLIVNRISDFPYGSMKTVTPSIFELVCIYTFLISASMLWHIRKNQERTPPRNRQAIAGIAVIVTIVFILDAGYWVHRRYFSTDMIVTYMDVGQGNAAVIEMPGGKTMLVDGGGFGDNTTFDVGALIVAPFLWRNKIKHIDKVILSHPHADHLNGLLYILDNFKIGKVISTHYPSESASYKRFLKRIESQGIAHPPFADLRTEKVINGVRMNIFYPPAIQTPDLAAANLNNGSIIFKLSFNGTSFLFPGDAESAVERDVVNTAGGKLDSTVMLSPHHGSKTSSTDSFLDAVNPDTVIISARSGRYAFPSDEVLNRYKRRGYNVYKTEKHGAVRVVVKGDTVRVLPVLTQQK